MNTLLFFSLLAFAASLLHAVVINGWRQRMAEVCAVDALVPTDPRYQTIAIAAEARREGVRLLVEYDHETNPRGRGLDGAPMTRAADRVTVRAQVSW